MYVYVTLCLMVDVRSLQLHSEGVNVGGFSESLGDQKM